MMMSAMDFPKLEELKEFTDMWDPHVSGLVHGRPSLPNLWIWRPVGCHAYEYVGTDLAPHTRHGG